MLIQPLQGVFAHLPRGSGAGRLAPHPGAPEVSVRVQVTGLLELPVQWAVGCWTSHLPLGKVGLEGLETPFPVLSREALRAQVANNPLRLPLLLAEPAPGALINYPGGHPQLPNQRGEERSEDYNQRELGW